MHRASLVIVTPALVEANNGNWQTARRWAAMLRMRHRVDLADRWTEADAHRGHDLMIALHARRSAGSIDAWRHAGAKPLVLALTGTDLYRDIDQDEAARRSLDAADALVVLNELGARRLPAPLRDKCHVVLQSCIARPPAAKSPRLLRALMVGHLRDEKDPRTYLRAAARLASRRDIRFDHIGAALDPALGRDATALAATLATYRWLGNQTHGQALRRIRAAHVLVHTSVIEGGAHVIIEAIRSGTPVIASRIDGNLGLLGGDPEAIFEVGDDAALARLVERARDDPAWLAHLGARQQRRAPLFSPETEAATLASLVDALLAGHPSKDPR